MALNVKTMIAIQYCSMAIPSVQAMVTVLRLILVNASQATVVPIVIFLFALAPWLTIQVQSVTLVMVHVLLLILAAALTTILVLNVKSLFAMVLQLMLLHLFAQAMVAASSSTLAHAQDHTTVHNAACLTASIFPVHKVESFALVMVLAHNLIHANVIQTILAN